MAELNEKVIVSVEEGIDGEIITTYDDGTTTTNFVDGTVVSTDLDNTQTIVHKDGTVSTATETSFESFTMGAESLAELFGCGGNSWLEPKSPAKPKYPYNNVTQTESGHTFEMDDTPGKERIRIQHRTETFLEMHPDGKEVHKIQGDSFEIIAKDKNVYIKGVCNVTIQGDSVVNVQGDKYEYVKGNYTQIVDGEYSLTVKKKTSILSEDSIKVGANPDFGGKLTLIGGSVSALTDLYVNGEIVATKITARTRIDAGLGISAGPLGVASMGGVAAGPGLVPVPGCVTAAINMAAPTSLTTLSLSTCSFGTFMADAVNTLLHNVHTHISPRGPTSPPIPKELSA